MLKKREIILDNAILFVYTSQRGEKMSTRNPKNWTAIREIVRRGQDTLYRLKLGREWQNIVALVEHYYNPPGTSYPQSLGELCIELAQENISSLGATIEIDCPSYKQWSFHQIVNENTRRDIQELRGLMYYKHKDPVKERQTARLEWIINQMRSA